MIAQNFLTEFETEAITTGHFLERIPGHELTWRPHARSMTVGQLGLHIAQVPGTIATLALWDLAPAPDFHAPAPQPESLTEILDAHAQTITTVRRILPTFSDGFMRKTWSAAIKEQPILTLSRQAMLRSLMLNHWIQHRGQLGVYLRLLGAKVPASYGPSADESPFSDLSPLPG